MWDVYIQFSIIVCMMYLLQSNIHLYLLLPWLYNYIHLSAIYT